jgi:AbrB family looped-hinge helix DNA binding protein
MAKVTGKLQITIPRAVADQVGVRVGDELDVRTVGKSIQLDRATSGATRSDRDESIRERLAEFDQATRRQQARQSVARPRPARSRGWTREGLYRRGRAR